jgi:hypothetical protein
VSGKRGAHRQSGKHHLVYLEAINYPGDMRPHRFESVLAWSKRLV